MSVDKERVALSDKFNQALDTGRQFTWLGQKFLFPTALFGKVYYWFEDSDGKVYLVRAAEDGLPRFED